MGDESEYLNDTVGVDHLLLKQQKQIKKENKVAKQKQEPAVINCEFEGCGEPAKYDAKLKDSEEWAYMCPACFKKHGEGLGVGKGMLIAGQKPPDDALEKPSKAQKPAAAVNTLTASKVTEIRADGGISLEINGMWFKFSYGETRTVNDGDDEQQSKMDLWRSINREIEEQVNTAIEENR